MTLLELMIALGILSTALMATASAFSSGLKASKSALTRTRGTVFLTTVMEDLGAQEYDGLLALNGNRIFDQADADHSAFAVDLSAFQTEVGLLQVSAALIELPGESVITRISTLRCNR